MSRKEIWNKAVRKYGMTKWLILLSLSPVIVVVYALANVLCFVGDIGDRIIHELDNI